MYIEELDLDKEYFICEVAGRWIDYYGEHLPSRIKAYLSINFEESFFRTIDHIVKAVEYGHLRASITEKDNDYYKYDLCKDFDFSAKCKHLYEEIVNLTEDETITIKGVNLLEFEEAFFYSTYCKVKRENLKGKDKKLYIHQLKSSLIPNSPTVEKWLNKQSPVLPTLDQYNKNRKRNGDKALDSAMDEYILDKVGIISLPDTQNAKEPDITPVKSNERENLTAFILTMKRLNNNGEELSPDLYKEFEAELVYKYGCIESIPSAEKIRLWVNNPKETNPKNKFNIVELGFTPD